MKNERESMIFKTSLVGIVANVFLVIVKSLIGILSHSIAITMDAVNNLTDAVSSIITIIGTYFAGKDPDKKHPFGHGRTEYLATLAIAVIISYAGVTALIESVKGIIHPKTPEYSQVMLIILVIAIFVKVFLGLYFTKKGKVTKSDSLSASGKDALFDALISTGTVISAIVFLLTNVSTEAYLGILISAVIIKSGIEILADTLSKILGEGGSVELAKAIKKAIVQHEGVNGAYDLIFHNYGQDVYTASVHIEVDESMTADQFDVLSRRITDDIFDEFGIYMAAIGVYSKNTTDPHVIKMRERVSEIAVSHEYVNQVHGFYVNETDKKIRFDMVISFDSKSRAELYAHVMEDLKKEFPDYEISAGMDADYNEI